MNSVNPFNPMQAMLDNSLINEEYSMPSEEYVDLLLRNKLESNQRKNITTFGHMTGGAVLGKDRFGILIDSETKYYSNNFGYRDSDWNSKAEILAIGCSNTYGIGITEEGRWTNILEKKINKKIQNLSIPGGSINELVSKSFEYFKQFGNPEIMLCLFPDPFRVKLPFKKNLINGDFLKYDMNRRDGHSTDLILNTIHFDHNSGNISKKNKYFKTPYSYEEVLPIELPIFFSMQSIHMLEQYCKSNNIKLIWSSWDCNFLDVLNNIKQNPFNNFFSNEDLLINEAHFYKNCHKNYKNKFEKYFDTGLDIEKGLEHVHPGVHKHVHIAEAFYEKINNDNKDK